MLLLILLLSSCEDPLGFNKKHMKNNYYLDNFQSTRDNPGLFEILKRENGKYTNVFEGNIEEIALENNKIYAKVQKFYRGDKDGIYVLDIQKNSLHGPLKKIPEEINLIKVKIFYEKL